MHKIILQPSWHPTQKLVENLVNKCQQWNHLDQGIWKTTFIVNRKDEATVAKRCFSDFLPMSTWSTSTSSCCRFRSSTRKITLTRRNCNIALPSFQIMITFNLRKSLVPSVFEVGMTFWYTFALHSFWRHDFQFALSVHRQTPVEAALPVLVALHEHCDGVPSASAACQGFVTVQSQDEPGHSTQPGPVLINL